MHGSGISRLSGGSRDRPVGGTSLAVSFLLALLLVLAAAYLIQSLMAAQAVVITVLFLLGVFVLLSLIVLQWAATLWKVRSTPVWMTHDVPSTPEELESSLEA